jgi:hypothetical protein
MPKENLEESSLSVDGDNIVIRFSGKHADAGNLDLGDYAQSIEGWHDFFRMGGDLYATSVKTGDGEIIETRLSIRIVAERPGSFEVVIAFILNSAASGLIGVAAQAVVKWTFKGLMKWYIEFFTTYKTAKMETPNIERVIAALEAMAAAQDIKLVDNSNDELPPPGDSKPDQSTLERAYNRKRIFVEKIDTSIQDATLLLDHDCTLIEIIQPSGEVILAINENDRDAIVTPLTLPLPAGEWQQIEVRFERINDKTGRALVYIKTDGHFATSVSHSRIVDKAIQKPRNAYTEAFNEKLGLLVWGRQVRAERGRLNLMWHITAEAPTQGSLFGPDVFGEK